MNLKGLEATALTIRSLAIDAIEKANSGHPGLPLGCAEIGSYLFGEVMSHDPEDLHWINRDRFVLSAGHGSMLLYSLMFLSGYGITLNDIKEFRQLKSNTPGHPEYGWTPGVETSTGPLGQGLGNAVGMAIAAKKHAQKYNTEKFDLISSRIFALVGDGDLMEGISYESCSLAGHLKLNNLIFIYDSNKITIEGSTDICFTENVAKRFEAQNWFVVNINGHDFEDIKRGFDTAEEARIRENKPVIIIADTTIGKGCPNKQGTSSCHGAPLGKDELMLTKKELGIEGDFYVDENAVNYFNEKKIEWKNNHSSWKEKLKIWKEENPDLAVHFENSMTKKLPEDTFENLPEFKAGDSIPTRNAANTILNAISNKLDYVLSGSADLGSSTMTLIRDKSELSPENYLGYNVQYGIREHAMGAIVNGIQLFGGVSPVCGTFLAFVNYMIPAIRMAALMRLPNIYLFSHDSIFVGEDGPTHHPVEHMTLLRLIPNLNIMRPADATETKIAWEIAIRSKTTPSVIITSRQKIPVIDYSKFTSYKEAVHGAYILKKEKDENIDLIIIATGSEVSPALQAAEQLEKENFSVRVVNFFSTLLFERQSDEYKEKILPSNIKKRLAVEAGVTAYWDRFVDSEGKIIGINKFGISARAEDLSKYFGINKENIFQRAKDVILGTNSSI